MSERSLRLSLLLVVGAALAAFATALHGSFVNWDDSWLIVRNPYIRGLSHLPEILDPFGDRVLLGAEYLPVRDLSNVLDHFLFGVEPRGYRLGNWLLHGLAAGLAFVLLLEAFRSRPAALAGALLWAVHPLHAEVVAWASARKDLLCAVFALLACVLHLRAARRGDRGPSWGAAAAFLLATLSKTAAAAVPFVL
ncbi:MAG: glycosyltransferase family 39 protein, partial [Planctomycetes bacterium]|nr:glycosyltransferase family 39 protein [Planctomycetota bacterium]